MAEVNLKSLVGKLNPSCRQLLESSLGLCVSLTHYNVEIEHWLQKLLDTPQLDFQAILKSFDVNIATLSRELQDAIGKFKKGNSRNAPTLSPSVVQWMREAWLIASLEFGETRVRSGHLLLAMLLDDNLRRQALGSCPELAGISADQLQQNFGKITRDSPEESQAAPSPDAPARPGPAGSGKSKTPALDQFASDLTEAAKLGNIDPVLGRDDEIRQVIDILCRRRQNNPILTGEPGVGKTAVVEGFAQRIAAGDVPDTLKDVSLRLLDLALLQAGAGVKGEFENRLKSVIEEVKSSPKPIILFIDEAHTMIGAGGAAGQGDAANLLKPALARGELRTIAATTWAEYKKYFEKDAALARRFQVVVVDEPDEPGAISMMRGLCSTMEQHHDVRVLTEALEEAVKLSRRYMSGRQLPDKAVSLLDTTCARISLSQSTTPAAVEDCRRRIDDYNSSIEILEREAVVDKGKLTQIEELRSLLAAETGRLEELTARWNQELKIVQAINENHRALLRTMVAAEAGDESTPEEDSSEASPPVPREELIANIERLEAELKELQGDSPLVHACCDGAAIAETVASWTGIPIGRMVADEIVTVLNLKSLMQESIVGQDHALEQISETVRTSRAKLTDPNRPLGIFLLAGTSGVGKTETAITLANLLYGGESNLTIINMSEFKEEHKVSLLMGSPPGYVGYGEGGVLTEAVRRKPYSVVLLDEVEKAHPGVQDIFYQVFDKGHIKDSEGRDIDFKNTLVIMTSNAGDTLIKSLCMDPDTRPDPDGLRDAVYSELLKSFKEAFLGRVTIVPYFPLSPEIMRQITQLRLNKVYQRVKDNYRAEMSCSDAAIDAILDRCNEVDTGARNIDKILNRTLLPELSAEFLQRMVDGSEVKRITVDYAGDGFTYSLQ